MASSINNIIRADALGSQDLAVDFISTCFYLPQEILCHPDYKVDRIEVIEGREWQKIEAKLPPRTYICYDPSGRTIIKAAKFVGVSVRTHISTGIKYIIVKLWYGENTNTLFKYKQKVIAAYADNDKVKVA